MIHYFNISVNFNLQHRYASFSWTLCDYILTCYYLEYIRKLSVPEKPEKLFNGGNK